MTPAPPDWRRITPAPPGWRVDWDAIDARFDWIRAMRGCPQDPVHHAEGDVWIHVRAVCEAMASLDEFRTLDGDTRHLLFQAALLHDVAKPARTRVEAGRVSAPGHSQRGAVMARRILWESGADFHTREQICGLVRFHQLPFYLIDRPDARRMAHRVSQSARCDWLTILARADALGRVCHDQAGLLLRIALFRQFCEEERCLDRPREFASELSRFEYFRHEGRDPDYCAHDESKCEVILMSGLPGAGKDTWIRRHAQGVPVISLDEIRERTGAAPTGGQGAVAHEARERARVLLRRGEGFVWNATNLTSDLRGPLIELFAGYGARVRLVCVEAAPDALFARNRDRAKPVPAAAIERMLDRWETPDLTEAPTVEVWDSGVRLR